MEPEIISAAIAIIGSISFATIYWKQTKSKIKQARYFVDLLDDAIADDKITEEEWNRMWKAFKKLLTGKEV